MMNYICDITIDLAKHEKISGAYNSVESTEELTSKDRDILVNFKGKTILSLTVPKTVFNPYRTVAAPLLMDLIKKSIIDVKGKRLVDLGCGSGVIGLTATLRGSKSVLYTDINSNVVSIKAHSLFREGVDRVVIQNFCEREESSSFDMVIMATPSIVVSKHLDPDSYEPAVYRNPEFITHMIENAARVLISSGEFVVFYRIYPDQIENFISMIVRLSHYFDMDALKCLLQFPEEDGCIAVILSVLRT